MSTESLPMAWPCSLWLSWLPRSNWEVLSQGPMDLCCRRISESARGALAVLNLVLPCDLVFSGNKDQTFLSHFVPRYTEQNLLKLGSRGAKQEGR